MRNEELLVITIIKHKIEIQFELQVIRLIVVDVLFTGKLRMILL